MKKITSIISLTLVSILMTISVYGSDFVQPIYGKMVSDYAGVFSKTELSDLENSLRIFNDTSSTQIAVLTVNDLNGYSVSEYAIRTAEEWGVGQKSKDNGILMLVKPKNQTKGEIFIAVGYGLEGVIPDALAKRIINQSIIPHFQRNDYYSGVKAGVTNLMKLSSGEFTADSLEGDDFKFKFIVFLAIIFIYFIMSLFKRNNSTTIGNDDYNNQHRGGYIPPIIFFGGRGSSGGSGFGSGGSSFGGFGGGGFGGGGAGGSW